MRIWMFMAFGLLMLAGAAAAGTSEWIGPPAPGRAYPEGEAARQWTMLSHDLGRREQINAHAAEVYRPESLIEAGDRDPLDIVLRRTRALLEDVRKQEGAPGLESESAGLARLRERAAATPVNDEDARRAIFDELLVLRRRIAFANPLLDFNSLLFIKRHRSIFNHMCDQFYGITQRPGGGVFVLDHPFGEKPQLRDVLEKSIVENGRLKGQPLTGGPRRAWNISFDGLGHLKGEETQGGSFEGPELSFDGREIVFAYVECQGDRSHVEHLDPARGHWAEGRCYHLFKAGLDGSGLTMLTDGTFNDFDPCFMPSGRIAFISERRGGYLRCGRVCPTYTLFDTAIDGGGIRCLSHHETNEWTPSVTHEGLIAWTRWDYVDRHGRIAHMGWLTTPDGRDPRSIHGNFSVRWKRPDMELDIQPIPGSNKLVATGAPHHGQAFGSLVVIDPRQRDDDAMGPAMRLTPEVDFPESQGGTESFGTPWPLGENYFLCAYEPVQVPELYLGANAAGDARPLDDRPAARATRAKGTASKAAPAAVAKTKAATARKVAAKKAAAKKAAATLNLDKMTPEARKKWEAAIGAAIAARQPRKPYGLYLIDAFGNRELVYSDPEIACMNPIPVKPRPRPPVVAEMRVAEQKAETNPREATVGVLNVYDSFKAWPAQTKISALRVYQVYPLSVPSAAIRHKMGMQIPQGSDSINIARAVLGTVPVEPDGSANFIVPAGKELFFQALDAQGLAVQSMRSGTHFQPGEQHTCQGCHDPRQRTPRGTGAAPAALRRAPSRIAPDVDGTHPFSYPRLVQPMLDRNCVGCHARHPGKAPRLDSEVVKSGNDANFLNPVTYFYTSYLSLAPDFGFYNYAGRDFEDERFYRTIPGQFGARASKLYAMLAAGHHGVKLSPEDMHRLTVWLDSCSMFYGVYEEDGGLAQLRGEIARPTLE